MFHTNYNTEINSEIPIELSNNETITINKFDMNKLKSNNKYYSPRILIIGSSGSGKSWLIRDIMYNFRDLLYGKVISPYEYSKNFYNKFIPSNYIYHQFKEEQIVDLIKRQTNIIDTHDYTNENSGNAYLIMDDCDETMNFFKNEGMCDFLQTSNVLKIQPLILTNQHFSSIPTIIRKSFDYIFVIEQKYLTTRKKIHNEYCQFIEKYYDFDKIYDKISCNNFECMVINNITQSTKIKYFIINQSIGLILC